MWGCCGACNDLLWVRGCSRSLRSWRRWRWLRCHIAERRDRSAHRGPADQLRNHSPKHGVVGPLLRGSPVHGPGRTGASIRGPQGCPVGNAKRHGRGGDHHPSRGHHVYVLAGRAARTEALHCEVPAVWVVVVDGELPLHPARDRDGDDRHSLATHSPHEDLPIVGHLCLHALGGAQCAEELGLQGDVLAAPHELHVQPALLIPQDFVPEDTVRPQVPVGQVVLHLGAEVRLPPHRALPASWRGLLAGQPVVLAQGAGDVAADAPHRAQEGPGQERPVQPAVGGRCVQHRHVPRAAQGPGAVLEDVQDRCVAAR
mmetsp:Transcript_61712/g.198861  ORF Transcript_61712/g.198861 Transcript_61712/m.198861 type:complete len:314 (+) Transcript_61712:972-1913(+)